MAVLNPYANINWQSVDYVPSCSHEHAAVKEIKNLTRWGLRHIAVSNYHPSRPMYPLSDYVTLPDGVISSPNSEFYNMGIPNFHANALGSFAEEPEPNTKLSWKIKFANILAAMQYDDAGGITLNHPAWTILYSQAHGHTDDVLTTADLIEMLDFDERVLGIEFFNAGSVGAIDPSTKWSLDTWDEILLTGRRCWGFAVADHDGQSDDIDYQWRGRNILLVDEFTEHECLKAYREGRFYGAIYDTNLKFSSITFENNVLLVVAANADSINIVVDGQYHTYSGSSASFEIPDTAIYARVEAISSDNSIYSQPILFGNKSKEKSKVKKMLLLG